MKISLIIPAHARPDLVARCLRSIADADRPATLAEIIVVENGGRLGVADVVESFRSQLPVKYCYLEIGNLGKARNHGASIASGDQLIFIDDDTKVVKGFFLAYARAYELHGSNCFYGGSLTADYEAAPPGWLIPYLPNSARGFDLPNADSVLLTTPSLLGGNMSIPRALFERAGRYDSMSAAGTANSGFVGEETRLQLKMLSLGASGVYVGEARVLHWVPADRCSLDWLLKRRQRSGATDAETARGARNSALGFPAWMLRAWTKDSWQILAARATGRQVEHYAAPLLHRAYLGGYIAHAMSRRERAQDNWS